MPFPIVGKDSYGAVVVGLLFVVEGLQMMIFCLLFGIALGSHRFSQLSTAAFIQTMVFVSLGYFQKQQQHGDDRLLQDPRS